MKRLSIALFVAVLHGAAAASPTPVSNLHELPTGNGFGFSVFDAQAHKITQFLERPYRFLRPGTDPHGEGVYRRDLAYDVYFGARVSGNGGAWLPDRPQEDAGYVEQTGIVHSVASVGSVQIESSYLAPFGLQQNALVMIARATNKGGAATTVDLFALPNFRLGGGDADNPSATGEHITTTGDLSVETGALGDAGGALVYLPLGAVAKADCAGDGYSAVQAGNELPVDQRTCTGDDRTLIFQSSALTLQPGETKSFGLVIAFTSNAADSGKLGAALQTYAAGRTADAVLAAEMADWTAWRKPVPMGLSADETRVFRQAESTLRMAQIREPYSEQPKLKNHGMILASLPPGIWHIGWVRDATYAIVALAKTGHVEEAKDALRFFLSAEGGTYASYANGPYRISVTRYFGDGQEESDWNAQGPNIEFDGWGLYAWALRQTLLASGDMALLDETLPTKEKFLDALRAGVSEPLVRNLEPSGLVFPDTSIWESHWDNRKHYTYTSLAAARGLCDLAAIESAHGDKARADALRTSAGQLRAAIRANMLDKGLLLGGSKEGVAGGTYHDGAAIEAFNWEIFSSDDALYPPTLAGLDAALKVGSGGWRRNDDGLSKYDSNEWIVIDMRASQAFRKTGNTARADELVAWVTAQARANYDMIPELFNTFPEDGPLWSSTGATPMVGFGAGAYLLALLDRAGVAEPHDCGGVTTGGGDGGTTPIMEPSGCGCQIGSARVSCPALVIALFAIGGLLLAYASRRRAR